MKTHVIEWHCRTLAARVGVLDRFQRTIAVRGLRSKRPAGGHRGAVVCDRDLPPAASVVADCEALLG